MRIRSIFGMVSQMRSRQFDLERAGRAEAQALLDGLGHRGNDFGMGMAGDHRPPGADVVDVSIAVDVDQVGALGAFDERRRAADRGERAYRRIDAAGNNFAGRLEQVVLIYSWLSHR